jgi:hypothetical protein
MRGLSQFLFVVPSHSRLAFFYLLLTFIFERSFFLPFFLSFLIFFLSSGHPSHPSHCQSNYKFLSIRLHPTIELFISIRFILVPLPFFLRIYLPINEERRQYFKSLKLSGKIFQLIFLVIFLVFDTERLNKITI